MPTPGSYTIMASNQTGYVTVVLNFDPATGDLRDVPQPSGPNRCLVADNDTGIDWPIRIATADGTWPPSGQPTTVPVGHTAFSANQIRQGSGIVNVSQVEFSL